MVQVQSLSGGGTVAYVDSLDDLMSNIPMLSKLHCTPGRDFSYTLPPYAAKPSDFTSIIGYLCFAVFGATSGLLDQSMSAPYKAMNSQVESGAMPKAKREQDCVDYLTECIDYAKANGDALFLDNEAGKQLYEEELHRFVSPARNDGILSSEFNPVRGRFCRQTLGSDKDGTLVFTGRPTDAGASADVQFQGALWRVREGASPLSDHTVLMTPLGPAHLKDYAATPNKADYDFLSAAGFNVPAGMMQHQKMLVAEELLFSLEDLVNALATDDRGKSVSLDSLKGTTAYDVCIAACRDAINQTARFSALKPTNNLAAYDYAAKLESALDTVAGIVGASFTDISLNSLVEAGNQTAGEAKALLAGLGNTMQDWLAGNYVLSAYVLEQLHDRFTAMQTDPQVAWVLRRDCNLGNFMHSRAQVIDGLGLQTVKAYTKDGHKYSDAPALMAGIRDGHFARQDLLDTFKTEAYNIDARLNTIVMPWTDFLELVYKSPVLRNSPQAVDELRKDYINCMVDAHGEQMRETLNYTWDNYGHLLELYWIARRFEVTATDQIANITTMAMMYPPESPLFKHQAERYGEALLALNDYLGEFAEKARIVQQETGINLAPFTDKLFTYWTEGAAQEQESVARSPRLRAERLNQICETCYSMQTSTDPARS